jgi:hypothetical protein
MRMGSGVGVFMRVFLGYAVIGGERFGRLGPDLSTVWGAGLRGLHWLLRPR